MALSLVAPLAGAGPHRRSATLREPFRAPRSFHERDAFANCLANAALNPPVFASLAGEEENRACSFLLPPREARGGDHPRR